MTEAKSILAMAPIVPVLAIGDLSQAVPLARALLKGGIPVLEVTLRTSAGLPAIRAIREALPEAIVGAGTVRNAGDYDAALAAGSRFVVTPGLTEGILDAARHSQVPLIPGIATASELMRALEAGIDCLKFFPAETSGGAAALQAFAGPFPDVSFCPTGGIGLHNIDDYLALPAVLTVGGSWLTPSHYLAAGDWDAITELARTAVDHVAAFRAAQ